MSTLRTGISGRGLFLYSQIVRYTTRFHLLDKQNLDALEAAGRPAIWTSWHGVTMMVSGYLFRHFGSENPNLLVIVPDDWRGESLSEWVRLAGSRAFTISLKEESLVAARRLIQLMRQLKKGTNVYLNPDGPDGPSGVPKPGISFLASKSGAAVLPLGVYTSSRYQLRRWDRYSLPLPFSRITILFGKPLTIAPDEENEAARERIAAAINQAMAKARERHRSR